MNENFLGKPTAAVTVAKIQTLAVSLGEKALLMTPLLVTLAQLAATTERTQMLLEGQSNLLGYREYAQNAFELMDFLQHAEPLDRVFSETPHAPNGEPSGCDRQGKSLPRIAEFEHDLREIRHCGA